MKHLTFLFLAILSACSIQSHDQAIQGSWKLISSEYHKSDTIISNMTEGVEMIKIITPSHFAFLLHDLNKGQDSSNIAYSSGGGTYTFTDGNYVENLDYCTYREWEGHTFDFTIQIAGDTLIQKGIEEMADKGLEKENLLLIEKYVRIKL